MEIRFFTKVVFNSKDLMKVVKTKKKTYLYRAGKYLLSTARRNLGVRTQQKTVEFTNSFGFTQRETIWAHKAKVGHSPYDHTSWKKSFRFGDDGNRLDSRCSYFMILISVKATWSPVNAAYTFTLEPIYVVFLICIP